MTELRKTESELDEGLRLGSLLWPQKMAAELRRLHEENQALRTALAYTEQDLAYQEAKRLQALRTALAQPEPEPVAWHEPGAYGNVTTHKDWALANGWEPLYKEKKT